MELVDGEAKVCFEEDEDWLGEPEVLGRIESVYEVGRGCFCVLFRPWFVGGKLDWEEWDPEGKRGLYWTGLYLSYNWEYGLDCFCYFSRHFFVMWSGLPHVW